LSDQDRLEDPLTPKEALRIITAKTHERQNRRHDAEETLSNRFRR
jgi:hypothetical protein